MGKKLLDRRAFLMSSAGVGGVLALIAGSRTAGAFSVEPIPAKSGLGVAFANRCGGDALHAQILAQLESDLANRSGMPGSTISAVEYCPICGCPIIATRTIR